MSRQKLLNRLNAWRCQTLLNVCVVPLLLLQLAGCGGKEPRVMAPVNGKVTYQGKPLPYGQVMMIHNSGHTGGGLIRSDGSYELQAQVGENRVMIRCQEGLDLSKIAPGEGIPLKDYKSLIPGKYANDTTSGLIIDVVEGPNQRNWVLSD